MGISSPDPLPEQLASRPPGRKPFFWLRVVLTSIVWLVLFAVLLRRINAHDFGRAGLPETLLMRFAVETLLFTALAYGTIRSLPFGAKPGLRGTIALGLWIALIVLSDCLSRLEFGAIEAVLAALRDTMGLGGLLLVVLAYVLALALPFIPGVEIGLLIIMLFGSVGAMIVYAATITGLSLAFAAGRLIPERLCARLLNRLGIAVLDGQFESAVRGILAGRRSGRDMWQRFVARVMEYRYLSLAVSFNLPGNSVLGGGGGIALLCGASRQFEWHWFVLTVVLATAPIPVLVVSGGIDAGTLVHMHDLVQNLFVNLVGWFQTIP